MKCYIVITSVVCIDEDFVSSEFRTERGVFSSLEKAEQYVDDVMLKSKLRWDKQEPNLWIRSPNQSNLKQEVFDLDLGDASFISILEMELDNPEAIKYEPSPVLEI